MDITFVQELIAPRNLRYYDRDWRFRGTKDKLCGLVSRISGIDADVLIHNRPLNAVPTFEKKSWILGRRTTHHNDQFYCLLGLFGMKRNRNTEGSLPPLGDPVRRLRDSVKYFKTGYQPQVHEYDDGYGITIQSSYNPTNFGGETIGETRDWPYSHPATVTGSTSEWANGADSSPLMKMAPRPAPPMVTSNHTNSFADPFGTTGRLGLSHGGYTNSTRNTLVVGDRPSDYQKYEASPDSTPSYYSPTQVRLLRGR
jgi:hypothetical protein